MHLWYVNHYAGGPGIGAHERAFALAKAWQRQGHTVTVFVASFHHLLETKTPLAPETVVDGVRYVAVQARPYADNGAHRLLNIVDFSRNLKAVGLREAEMSGQPHAVIVSSPHPFAIFSGHALARRFGARLVFEIRDIWPLSITEILGTSRLHPFVALCATAERFALARADLVASVLPRANVYLSERGWSSKAFVWVPNGMGEQRDAPRIEAPISTEGSANAEAALAKVAQWRGENRTVIVHAGALGRPNAVDTLLEAVAAGHARREAENCRVLIVGSGADAQPLEQLAQARGISGLVHFAGRVVRDEVAGLLAGCDIAYAGVRPLDRLYRFGVSLNKFADYYAARLPVFLPIAPCGDPVSQSGGGIARRTPDAAAAWSALHELVLMSPQARRALGEKGTAYMEREYRYEVIAARYAEAIAASPSRSRAERRRHALRRERSQ